MKYWIGLIIYISIIHSSVSQTGLTDDMAENELQFNASNKQINQFFRRFNGEEDGKGNRLNQTDKAYRSSSLRRNYLPNLFDRNNENIADQAKVFVRDVTNKQSPRYLDFHANNWFAEVQTVFSKEGKEISGLLFMKLQQQGQGYEWVIDQISFDHYQNYFKKDTSESKRFLHPMSHELDFMTLRKALAKEKHTEQFTARDFRPDQLTLFLHELNQGVLSFKTVRDVKFHFFTIDDWYFSLANFNRMGYNSGWLIDNVVPIQNDQHRDALKNYIYDIK
ncbi:hypothetical protein [Ekhidna sp.]|uniref:hypothetical protein n=1 Tax=Ekhidna sp. TaxID=2608089 RepID=UPI003CCB9C17